MDGSESGTAGAAGCLWGIMIRGQRREGQGRPDDANGRHRGSSKIKKEKYKKRGAKLPPDSDNLLAELAAEVECHAFVL
jgi:hypothetical protein